MFKTSLGFAFIAIISVQLAAQQDQVTELWKDVTNHQRAGKLDVAVDSIDKIIELLEPKSTQMSFGIQLSSAYRTKAALHFGQEEYVKCEQALLKGLAETKKIKPPQGIPENSPMVEMVMGIVNDQLRSSSRALADYYLSFGDLKKATDYFEQAQAIKPNWKIQSEKNPALSHLVLASDISSMDGNFYRQTGNYAAATESYTKILEVYEQAWKKVELQYGKLEAMKELRRNFRMNYLTGKANFLMELAEIASIQGLNDHAIGFATRSRDTVVELIAIYKEWAEENMESGKLPEEDVQATYRGVIYNANNMVFHRAAKIFRAAGEEETALELILEGIKRFDKDMSKARYFSVENNVARPEETYQLLGDLQVMLGRKEDARKSYQSALKIVDKVFRAGHPGRLSILESIAMLYALSGKRDEAIDVALRIRKLQDENLATVLEFASQSQRLAYRTSIDSWSLLASLRLDEEVALAVFRTKGIVLDSLLADQKASAIAGKDPEKKKTLLRLKKLRREYMELILGGKSETSDETTRLRQTIKELDAKLASEKATGEFVRRAAKVTSKQIGDALPKESALIEFIRYKRHNGPGRFTEYYGAVILQAGTDKPVFQPLSPATEIESAMAAYAKAVRGKPSDQRMANLLRALTKMVWEPLEPHLPKKGTRLILAPDAELNFLSFAGLLDSENQFLAESYFLSYVSSARDLLRGVKPSDKNDMVIVANPDYGKPNVQPEKKKDAEKPKEETENKQLPKDRGDLLNSMRGYLSTINFKPLAGTAVEAKVLNEIVKKKWGWEVETFLQKEATENAVNLIKSPRILHLSTHGFYLSRAGRLDPLVRARRYWDPSSPKLNPKAVRSFCSNIVLDNPMHRSGVALAKANETLKVWGEGKVPATSNDGILSAAEVALLDLNSTWLVVLSACETGLGEANSGEGVMGLRRAFAQAGAQNVLVTLWPIADRETVFFMDVFYSNLKQAENDPAIIAHLTQLKYLREFRKEKGLTAAIKLAAPFVLNFQQ